MITTTLSTTRYPLLFFNADCAKPSGIDHAVFTPDKAAYAHNDALQVQCPAGYTKTGTNSNAVCTDGTFKPPLVVTCAAGLSCFCVSDRIENVVDNFPVKFCNCYETKCSIVPASRRAADELVYG